MKTIFNDTDKVKEKKAIYQSPKIYLQKLAMIDILVVSDATQDFNEEWLSV